MKSLKYIQKELADWMYRFYIRLPKQDFQKALETASRIARRGRSKSDYEYLIHTATFNFLKFSIKWVQEEVHYIQPLLLESGFIRSKEKHSHMIVAYNYISYMVPRVYLCLQDLHEDHTNPKGIYTDLNKLYLRPPQDDEKTCYDRDDYQKDILEEVSLDDLYT